jgi:hypothetical protein
MQCEFDVILIIAKHSSKQIQQFEKWPWWANSNVKNKQQTWKEQASGSIK